MNCKPGDLAIIVKSAAGNEGAIVEVLGPAAPFGGLPVWFIESKGSVLNGLTPPSHQAEIPDAWLRPIRPGDMEDETPVARDLEVPA